ncbi:hypothetical protein S7711_01357 [Stachybotrys chartarum IBT 7711]|uniref:Molybdate-anion transporter n=1 Tax=Stachybotrys chartarum (strain CBS 109288 / IBT 7711) TaxID=1280523 RepID=A0A084BBT7_STACB|nr:hypothetical protein S7711_01357 [Stachybotrys chartarum IBT 7711]
MDFYAVNLVVLIGLLTSAAYAQHRRTKTKLIPELERGARQLKVVDEGSEDFHRDTTTPRFFGFCTTFLVGYGLAIAADWLQGGFLYSLYKNTFELPEPTIASLFATGFFCGGISATFVGTFADRFGRKLACLCYCGMYAASCLTLLSPYLPILFFGRALGGVSTTLLFTVFETWMVSEYHRQGFGHFDTGLSFVYSTMSILNGFIAATCGVLAQVLVSVTGSELTPFLVSIACLLSAGLFISRSWGENFGVPQSAQVFKKPAAKHVPIGKTKVALFDSTQILIQLDMGILSIGFAVTMLEGAMYIMVYSWSQALASARQRSGTPGAPPFGLIFANFMCALTLGSFLFAHVTRKDNSLLLSSQTVQLTLSLAAAALLLTIVAQVEAYRFWAFCVFEFCLGMYFPSIGYLKGRLVSEEQRGKVYGLMRVPLNAFVLVVLSTIKDGDKSREDRFITCSSLLLVGTVLMARYVPQLARQRHP